MAGTIESTMITEIEITKLPTDGLYRFAIEFDKQFDKNKYFAYYL